MNNICTSIEQSKKLLELGIDVNTADMVYCIELYKEGWKYSNEAYPIDGTLEGDDIPAWSLSALFNVLPKIVNNETLFVETSPALWHIGYRNVYTARANNLIDGCYELIVKLHELKLGDYIQLDL